ncbi:hypothetical protein D0Z07_4343 [Hyphodiscus hymeniophilus]|uniref:Restriction endonuclease type IV Mrr domain-containing protein n=1 Tax=Hyphodiscus hymeniophilus TaxID=353542 RepID=A0A9P6VKK0_9HELO|nr:hypothetical protein D0Z07_4343 [Hyphodiscus hymeniophilus]
MFAIRHLSRKRSVPPILSLSSIQRPEKQSTRKYVTNIEELEYPPGSTNHHDLRSFLEYAARVDLNPESKIYVGTHYEYTVQSALEGLGMPLKRIGGASDYGTDLLGTWSLPPMSQPLKVLIQCKGHARKVDPSHARELEGAFVGAPQGWRESGTLAFLVSQEMATKGLREALSRSKWPMGYVQCSRGGKISQIFWNRRAEQEGLEGIGVGLKYTGEGANEKETILTWKGKVLKG